MKEITVKRIEEARDRLRRVEGIITTIRGYSRSELNDTINGVCRLLDDMGDVIDGLERLREVVRAAGHLEFVAMTPGPNVDNPSFEEVLFNLVLDEFSRNKNLSHNESFKKYCEQIDEQRRERIRRAWSKLRHALEVWRVSPAEDDKIALNGEELDECAECKLVHEYEAEVVRELRDRAEAAEHNFADEHKAREAAERERDQLAATLEHMDEINKTRQS